MGKSRDWTKSLLEMLYVEFNDDLIPRDLGGDASILKSGSRFHKALIELMPAEDFLKMWTEEEVTHMIPRIQILAFWLVYHQFAHTSAKTYVAQLRSKEPLAVVLLDTKVVVPESVVSEILLSIFIDSESEFKNKEIYTSHENVVIPFASPFGASVLHCGAPDCGVSFLPEEVSLKRIADGEVEWSARLSDQVRRKRRDHLVDVFGILGEINKGKEKERNETGLPGVTKIPERPSEIHTCMRIGMAKTWAKLTREERKYLAGVLAISWSGDGDEGNEGVIGEFVMKARKQICGIGRGNVFSATMERDIRAMLPSLLEVLRLDIIMEGKEGVDGDVSAFEYDFGGNRVEGKIR
ncbi:hypothetical protein SBOR_5104 [Sclerotinia borealis F-4128]|uniref:Uncharacterized protein n=1 Tax=Sclerotinia borealis (strain F-4128) TaxID=1432307 RepID=W9CIK7_SCLBF|nr:hypothetical protein SBOR_5104 [Sclerotinia borealis F-4128]